MRQVSRGELVSARQLGRRVQMNRTTSVQNVIPGAAVSWPPQAHARALKQGRHANRKSGGLGQEEGKDE